MKTARRLNTLVLLGALGLPLSAWGGWGDFLDQLMGDDQEQTTGTPSQPLAQLSQSEIAKGLKEALDKGIQTAVQQLGRENGYFNDPQVRIPMPESLAWAERSLRTLGQEELADEFVLTLNRAAEKAVPEVVDVFQGAIKAMTLEDARQILQGPEDAATQYFRRSSGETLAERIQPIVAQATDTVGVTSAYKALMARAGAMGQFLSPEALDLDRYVTDQAMDGLFLKIAEEEQRIRENPAQRTTEILKKVFGAYR